MVADFIESALIIDDKPEDVRGLIKILEDKGIAITFYEPNKVKGASELKNRKIIFLDLYLDPSITELPGNISKIRKIFKTKIGKNFGSYGIVLWSAHAEEIEEFQERINRDKDIYTLPLFIVGLSKTDYVKENNYSSLFDDINTELINNSAATFFLEWSSSVQKAQNAIMSSVYSLLPNYKTLSDDLTFILKKLAKNHTGVPDSESDTYPLYIDAYKAFDDILHGELINCQESPSDIFDRHHNEFSEEGILPLIYAQINALMLIDKNNIDQETVVPGNVYEIIEKNSYFETEKAPEESLKIVMEITPPCDFSNGNKVKSRLIGGFLIKYKGGKQIEQLKCDKMYMYKEIYPIKIPNIEEPQIMLLDFRYFGSEEDNNLKENTKYKILFRVKPNLFADILQKFSSHAARLGLSIIR